MAQRFYCHHLIINCHATKVGVAGNVLMLVILHVIQGDHLSVGEFDSCQGNVKQASIFICQI